MAKNKHQNGSQQDDQDGGSRRSSPAQEYHANAARQRFWSAGLEFSQVGFKLAVILIHILFSFLSHPALPEAGRGHTDNVKPPYSAALPQCMRSLPVSSRPRCASR